MTPPTTGPTDAPTREELHLRRIDLRGFRRSDGLFELEARLTDRKPFEFRPPSRDEPVPAGEPIHDHELGVVFGEDMVIRELRAGMRAWPYRECPGGADALQAMVGVRIGRGWAREVRARLPPEQTCTHLKEMLLVLPSAALQAVYSVSMSHRDQTDPGGRPSRIDSCYAYGADRELVARFWPGFRRPAGD